MIEKSVLPIREFVYFDREKVVDFVSELQGGLPEKRKRISSQKSARFDFGLKWLLNLGRKGGTKKLTWEEIQSETNASLFERLHKLLQERGSATKLESFDIETWNQLQPGEFLELQGRVEFSALEVLLDVINKLTPLIKAFSSGEPQDPNLNIGFQVAQTSQQNSQNIRIIPSGTIDKAHFILISSLNNNCTRTSKEELVDEYTIFGRIKRQLDRNETYEPFSPLPNGVTLEKTDIQNLLTKLKDAGPIMGSTPKMEDLRVSGPAIVLTPIAIYR